MIKVTKNKRIHLVYSFIDVLLFLFGDMIIDLYLIQPPAGDQTGCFGLILTGCHVIRVYTGNGLIYQLSSAVRNTVATSMKTASNKITVYSNEVKSDIQWA